MTETQSVQQIPPFTTVQFVTKDGEECTATKKDGIVTVKGDKNGVREIPYDQFMKELVENLPKNVNLERTPNKDKVQFRGKETPQQTEPAAKAKESVEETNKKLNKKYMGIAAAALAVVGTGIYLLGRGKWWSKAAKEVEKKGKEIVDDTVNGIKEGIKENTQKADDIVEGTENLFIAKSPIPKEQILEIPKDFETDVEKIVKQGREVARGVDTVTYTIQTPYGYRAYRVTETKGKPIEIKSVLDYGEDSRPFRTFEFVNGQVRSITDNTTKNIRKRFFKVEEKVSPSANTKGKRTKVSDDWKSAYETDPAKILKMGKVTEDGTLVTVKNETGEVTHRYRLTDGKNPKLFCVDDLTHIGEDGTIRRVFYLKGQPHSYAQVAKDDPIPKAISRNRIQQLSNEYKKMGKVPIPANQMLEIPKDLETDFGKVIRDGHIQNISATEYYLKSPDGLTKRLYCVNQGTLKIESVAEYANDGIYPFRKIYFTDGQVSKIEDLTSATPRIKEFSVKTENVTSESRQLIFDDKPIVKPEDYNTATSADLIKEWERLGAVRENIDDVSQFKLHYELGMNESRIESILMGTGHVQINNKWIYVMDITCSDSGKMAQRLEDFKNESAEDLIAQFYYVLKEQPDLEGLSSASFQAPIKLLKEKGWRFENCSWIKQEKGQTIIIPQKIGGKNHRGFVGAESFDSKIFKLVQKDDKHCELSLKVNELPQENILSGIGHEKTNKVYRKGKINVLSPAVVEFIDGVWTVTKELEYIIIE